MIELNFKGKCEGCECADLEVDYFIHKQLNEEYDEILTKIFTKIWTVKCKHEDICNRIEDYIAEKMRNE